MNYIKLTENNDNEGESWSFYIPLEGNEAEIEKLRSIIKETEYGEYYELEDKPIPESEVDVLVKHARGNYMSDQNKLSGKLQFGNKVILSIEAGKEEDLLYKGGIGDFMVKE